MFFSQFLQGSIEHTLISRDKQQAKFLLEELHALQLPQVFWPKALTPNATPLQSFSFSFDIDGVLVKGSIPLPHSSETLYLLQRLSIPFIFLTNGGGMTEAAHVHKLEKRFNVKLDIRQFIQSHTPFHDLVPAFKHKNILVLGGEHGNAIREVAHDYGFKHVITAADLLARFPTLFPFCEISKEHLSKLAQPLPQGPITISAILVWSSPREWGLDLQVVRDLLLSEQGRIGTLSPLNGNRYLPNHGYQQDGQPQLHFSNPDLSWPTEFPQLRFAQGAFRAALEGIWAAETQGKAQLISHTVGKPEHGTYLYAEKTLKEYQRALHGSQAQPIKTVFMIDDNPSSGIKGANEFTLNSQSNWKSILVESGVHVAGTKPVFEPTTTQENVKAAIRFGLAAEGWVLPQEAWTWAAEVTDTIKHLQAIIEAPDTSPKRKREGADEGAQPSRK